MASHDTKLIEKFAAIRASPQWGTFLAPCIQALTAKPWENVTEFSKEDFFEYGPFTDKQEQGIPHEGGVVVQPGMLQLVLRNFYKARGGSSGLVKDWFPPTSYVRTGARKRPEAECAQGFRRALPVSGWNSSVQKSVILKHLSL